MLYWVRDHSPAMRGPRLDERLGGGEIAVVRGPMKCAPPEEPGKRLSNSMSNTNTSGLENDRTRSYTKITTLQFFLGTIALQYTNIITWKID